MLSIFSAIVASIAAIFTWSLPHPTPGDIAFGFVLAAIAVLNVWRVVEDN